MANQSRLGGVRSLIDGFNEGFQGVGNAVQAFEMSRAGQAKATESQGFTAKDGAELEALANAKDAEGKPYYNVEAGPDGGYRVTNNFQIQGDDGTAQTPAGFQLGPRKVTDFMGQRTEGAMDPAQVERARAGAMADIAMKHNPIQGMAMRRQLTQDDRDAVRFDQEGSQFKRTEALGDLQIKAGERGERNAQKVDDYDAAYSKHSADWDAMGDDERNKLIGKLSHDTGIPGFGVWVPGKGKAVGYMQYMAPSGAVVKLSNKEAKEMYALSSLMQIDPARARKEMDAASSNVRAMAAQVFETQAKGAQVNNAGLHMANSDENQRGMLGIHQGQLRLGQDRLAMDRMGTPQLMQDAKGDTYALTPTMTREGLKMVRSLVSSDEVKGLKPFNPRGGAGGAHDLTEREKIALTAVARAVGDLDTSKMTGAEQAKEVAKVYRKFGLDPEQFGQVDPIKELARSMGADPAAPSEAPKAGLSMPLANPTLSQLRAMGPQAVAGYANQGHPVAKALVREAQEKANSASGPVEYDPQLGPQY